MRVSGFILIQLLLSALFMLSAVAKILALPGSMAHRQRLGVPLWLWRATGFAQALGVIGLLVGLVKPQVTPLAGGWLGGVMIGAFIAHWRVRDHWRHYVTVVSLLALTLRAERKYTLFTRWSFGRSLRYNSQSNASPQGISDH